MDIVGYKLKVNGGVYVDRIIDTGEIEYDEIIDALTASVTYGVQVAAYDAFGVRTAWSAPVFKAPLPASMLVDNGGNAILDGSGNAIIVYV